MENLHDVGLFENPEFGVGEKSRVDEDSEIHTAEPKKKRRRNSKSTQIKLTVEPKKKRQKKSKSTQIKLEDDDNEHIWLDTEVNALFLLKGAMQLEFIKNAKKQGV